MHPFGFHDVHLAMVQIPKRDLKAPLMSIAIPTRKQRYVIQYVTYKKPYSKIIRSHSVGARSAAGWVTAVRINLVILYGRPKIPMTVYPCIDQNIAFAD